MTKDYQGLPTQHHTHTLHSAFLPPVTVGGSSLSSLFGLFRLSWLLCCLVPLTCFVLCRGVDLAGGAMDQAALQQVTVARSSGTPCGTARGAVLRIRGYLVGSLVRRVVFFLEFVADPMVLLCCNALQVLC